jgi:hypothetical protein
MNRITIPLKEFLALTALMFCNASADAADRGLFGRRPLLGFRATGGTGATQTYLLNIGQASTYRDAAAGFVLYRQSWNIGADLVSIYGNSWFNRADLFWGVGGSERAVSADVANTPMQAARRILSGRWQIRGIVGAIVRRGQLYRDSGHGVRLSQHRQFDGE